MGPPARPAPGRRRRRRGADRLGRARPRLGLRRRRPARAGDRAPARRRPGLADPAQPQRGAAALGPGPQRPRPGRPGAVRGRAGDAALAAGPGDRLRPRRAAGAGRSVVRVLGTACGLGVEGSGWAVRPDLIVTNAHVVAGSDDTTVTTQDGVELDATPVYYDPEDDLALLRVGAELPTLPISSRREPGSDAAVLGYPENGPYALSRPASAKPGPRSARTPTATGRSIARSPRCAARSAAATPAGRWSTPRAGGRHRLRRHHDRISPAASRSPPSRSATRSSRRPHRSTPAPAPAEAGSPSLTFSKLGSRGTGPLDPGPRRRVRLGLPALPRRDRVDRQALDGGDRLRPDRAADALRRARQGGPRASRTGCSPSGCASWRRRAWSSGRSKPAPRCGSPTR